MVGKIKFGKLGSFPWTSERTTYTQDTKSYRLEKLKGDFKGGEAILPENLIERCGSVKVFEGDKLRSVLQLCNGIISTVASPLKDKKGAYKSSAISVTQGDVCSEEVVHLDRSLFKNMEIQRILGGDFNGDGRLDFAYVVKDTVQGLMSYVFYGQNDPLSKCFDDKKRVAWPVIKSTLDEIFKVHGQIAPFVIKYFQENIERISNIISGREHLVPLMKRGLWLAIRYFTECSGIGDTGVCQNRKALGVIEKYLTFVERHKDDKELVKNIFYQYHKIGVLPYYNAIAKFDAGIKNPKKLSCIIKLFNGFCNTKDVSPEYLGRLVPALLKAAVQLPTIELTIIVNTIKRMDDEYDFSKQEAKKVVPDFVRIVKNTPKKDLYRELYKFFGGPIGVSAETMLKYKEILKNHVAPKFRDIEYAEKHIGHEAATLLWKKFGIVRFGRYHPTVLEHMIQMARDKDYQKKKPLVLFITAKADSNDAFYYGRFYKYNPKVRTVVVEVGNYGEFKDKLWQIRRDYGIPDVLMFTSHGLWDGIAHIVTLKDEERFKKDFKGIFGNKPPQIIINACLTGAPPQKGNINAAQMVANVFNAEVHAARGSEALLDMRIEVKNGRARLTPLFFELGPTWHGFNYGGMVFKPWKKGEPREIKYTMPWEENLGWQFGLSTGTYAGKFLLGGSFGGTIAPFSHFRLRLEAGLDAAPTSGEIYPAIKPEIAFGLTNHIMLSAGAAIGLKYKKDIGFSRHIETHTGLKILLNAINSELDIGVTGFNKGNAAFFLNWQTRF